MRLLLSLALCAVVFSSSAVVAAVPGSTVHLRPQDDRLTQLLRDGSSRSATFKALVDRIEASNVIVYVALNPLMKSNLSGMLTWMTQAGGYRYVRASISPELTPNQMIATIAHELQHAVEVIEDATVTDEKSLVALYRRIGQQSGTAAPSRWETAAAQRAGFQVRKELVEGVPATMMAKAGEAARW
jgi:predicted transcriptional regulator